MPSSLGGDQVTISSVHELPQLLSIFSLNTFLQVPPFPLHRVRVQVHMPTCEALANGSQRTDEDMRMCVLGVSEVELLLGVLVVSEV